MLSELHRISNAKHIVYPSHCTCKQFFNVAAYSEFMKTNGCLIFFLKVNDLCIRID